jgi:hypothetical protein
MLSLVSSMKCTCVALSLPVLTSSLPDKLSPTLIGRTWTPNLPVTSFLTVAAWPTGSARKGGCGCSAHQAQEQNGQWGGHSPACGSCRVASDAGLLTADEHVYLLPLMREA